MLVLLQQQSWFIAHKSIPKPAEHIGYGVENGF